MDEITKRNIEAYNTSVDNYFENTKNLELPEMRIREEFLSLIKTGKRIIDIGCGPGRDAKIFSDK
jgi:ubiquinone/menaquinone biosynthesis C-methylase UbiE